MDSKSVAKAVRLALLASAGAAFVVPTAFAQSAPQTGETANQNQATNTTVQQLGTVEVTGTRILRTSTETAQPITIITSKQIQATGLTTIGDVLQNLTQSGSAINTLVNNGGTGETNIDLRYFGANRVLVLVNGKRWTPDLSGAVDLNSIPTSVVDHIEILQDGASAIYGSDAITGVVNIITVRNFNGAEASAYMGMYDNDYGGFSGWDGKVQQYSYTMGLSNDRSSLVANIAYNNQAVVWGGQRAQSSPIGPFSTGQVSSWSTLKGEFVLNIGNRPSPGTATCSPWVPAQPDPSTPGSWIPASGGTCNMTLINAPTMNPTLANFENYSIAGNRMRASAAPFQTPLETKSIYLQGHYDIASNVTFTGMAAATVRTSQQELSAGPQSIGAGSGPDIVNYLPFGVGANNPYNPFGVDLVANSSQFCPSAHYAGGTATCTPNNNIMDYTIGRLFAEGGTRLWSQNNTSYTVREGLSGFFDALGSEWDWDTGASYGNVYQSQSAMNSYNTSQLVQQLDSPGWAQCNGPGQLAKPAGDSVQVNGMYYPILIPGCVPFNLFGGFVETGNTLQGNGSITPAMLAYTAFDDHSIDEMSQRDYTANITGDLAQLPAGPLAVALGAEYLEIDGYDHPDALRVEGNVDENPAIPTAGAAVDECRVLRVERALAIRRTDGQVAQFGFGQPLVAGLMGR